MVMRVGIGDGVVGDVRRGDGRRERALRMGWKGGMTCRALNMLGGKSC